MDNGQRAPILSAIEQKPICILRREQQRPQVCQEKELLEHQEQLFSQTVTESHPQTTPPIMAVKRDQADAKRPPMVHDSVTDKRCDIMDSGESPACREDLLKQIQLLKTQVKEQQDHSEALRVFHGQHCDQVDEMINRTLKAHEEQIKAKDFKINCLKKENAANYSKHLKNAREEVKKEMKACDTANAYLRGKLESEEAKVKGLYNWIMQNNALPHEGNSQRFNLQSLLSGHEQAAAQSPVEELHDEDKILEHFLKVIQGSNLQSSALSVEHRNKELCSKAKTVQEVELLAEKEELCMQVAMLKSSLCEQEQVTAAVLEQLEKARALIRLKTAVRDENKAKSEAQSKVVSQTGEINELKRKVKNLELALNEERRNRVPQSQFTALQMEKAELQKERDKLRLQGNTLKSCIHEKTTQEALRNDDDSMLSLREQEGAKEVSRHRVEHLEKEAQYMKREIKNLMDEKDQLHREVKNLRLALSEEKRNRIAENEFISLIQEEKARFEAERDQLRSQVSSQKSLLREKNTAYEDQRKVKTLEEERAKLHGICLQVGNLESALVEKDTTLKEAQNRIKSLKEEKGGLQSSVENLKTALSKQQKDTEGACSKVTQQEQKIRKHKAMAQALEENLKSARDMFKTMVESGNAKFSAALAEKKSMEKKAQELRQETERLTVVHRKEVSVLQSSEEEKREVLQCKTQELSDALKASQENNSALLTHNQELQETIRTKEEHIQETENRRKQKKKWFGQCFGR